MAVKIQLRRGTNAEWTSADPVLMAGEVGVDTDGGYFRIGNGEDNYLDLPIAGRTIGELIENAEIKNYVESLSSQTGTGAITLNLADANVFEVTVDADTATTLSLDNIETGAHSFTLVLHQHADGPAITLDYSIIWAYDEVPDIVDDETNVFTFFTLDGGTTWYGQLVGNTYGDGT